MVSPAFIRDLTRLSYRGAGSARPRGSINLYTSSDQPRREDGAQSSYIHDYPQYDLKCNLALAKVRKVGGSLVVTIPKEVAEAEGLQVGGLVRIEVKKVRRSWFGAARGVAPFTAEDELRAHE